MADDPEAGLVKAAVAGNREAFEALLRGHYDRIHCIAWQLTGSRADADDVAQDVCCALVEKIGGFRGEAKFSTWLTGITFNACRDLKRRRRSFAGFSERFSTWVGLIPPEDGRDAYDAIWLKSAIAKLRPAYREAVVLVVGQQLTHSEAAKILGIAEATVSWRMSEARKLLGADPE